MGVPGAVAEPAEAEAARGARQGATIMMQTQRHRVDSVVLITL